MKNVFKITLGVLLSVSTFYSCSDDNDNSGSNTTVTKESVLQNYANIVYNSYKDSYSSALELQAKIKVFVNNPTDATLEQAKQAWLTARDIYGQTEVYRGSGGPIDTEGLINNEGQLNAWPLNEAYIDYVADQNSFTGIYDESIIASDAVITKEFLAGKNEEGDDEKAVATGWHAIEFLLWGQDNTAPSKKLAGQRPVSDFKDATNNDRRKQYLLVVTDLLVDDLLSLVTTWEDGGSYRTTFEGLNQDTALNNMLNGTYFLAFEEASKERMLAPATSSDGIAGGLGQEDEHSCFSDNTHRDVFTNAQGIFNVLTGNYGSISGASFVDLLKLKDKDQAVKLEDAIATAKAAIKAIDDKAKAGTPFDLMIMEESLNSPGVVLKGNDALVKLGNVIKESAAKLGITTALPE